MNHPINAALPAAFDTPKLPGRIRVLFFAEAVTLAHVARPLVLAQGLVQDSSAVQFEPVLAVDPRYERLYATSPIPRVNIHSIPSAQFAAALANGKPIYTTRELEQYVQEDLKVIREVQPDIIVGDMRLSLAVSARIAGVPYLNLTNAYWSPYARVEFPVPQIPLTRFVPIAATQMLFDLIRPMVFARHTRPMNRVLRNHKLPELGHNLQRVYAAADHTLYVDAPGQTPMVDPLPDNHHFIGPILWEPDLPKPDWWDQLAASTDKPIVYVNTGSSGPANLLAKVIQGLKDLPVITIAATAGKTHIKNPPANARIADFLPGLQACALADLVICNGGSPSTQQAIAAGKPMLCLPSNLDQFLNTQNLLAAGAARQIRADRVNASRVQQTVAAMLGDDSYKTQTMALTKRASQTQAVDTLAKIIKTVIGQRDTSETCPPKSVPA